VGFGRGGTRAAAGRPPVILVVAAPSPALRAAAVRWGSCLVETPGGRTAARHRSVILPRHHRRLSDASRSGHLLDGNAARLNAQPRESRGPPTLAVKAAREARGSRHALGGAPRAQAPRPPTCRTPCRLVSKAGAQRRGQTRSRGGGKSTKPNHRASAVVTNRGWETNYIFPSEKISATCEDSGGHQKQHTWTGFCGGSCGSQFVGRPTAYQNRVSPHQQTA